MSITRKDSEDLYKDVKDEIDEVIIVSDISDEHLKDETTAPLSIEEYQKSKQHVGYVILSGG